MTTKEEGIKKLPEFERSKQIIVAQVGAVKMICKIAEGEGKKEFDENISILKALGLTENECFMFLGIDWALEGCPGFDFDIVDIRKRAERKMPHEGD